MTFKKLFIFIFLFPVVLSAQHIKSPPELKNFFEPTSYAELSTFIGSLRSSLLNVEIIGQTVENRNIYALKFSSSAFGKDKSKVKVLIFAQQHGNEQSGKEGALLLIAELLKPENNYLFDKIDLALIPQINADGSEQNKRRNGHNTDLNRNHLILEEPELIALHNFFDKYRFEVNMDVHEYAPYYSEAWKAYGYRTNSDILIGWNTNINIAREIRELSADSFLPFYRNFLTERKFSNSIYAPGGPPEQDYIRHSTFDINDGRQSFGIQNSFSLIQEGLNGTDNFKNNIEHRAKSQMTGMRALLEFVYQNDKSMKKMISTQRKKLCSGKTGNEVSIQMKHVGNGKQHPLPVYSYATGKDSIIMVKDYRPFVQTITNVTKPDGYLIPKSCTTLTDWVKRHNLITSVFKISKKQNIEQYWISAIDSIDFEGDIIIDPVVNYKTLTELINSTDYIYIPTTQLKGNLIVIALEPKSELGLVTYSKYRPLLKVGENFPVLRVVKNKK